ncbi:MAG: DUF4388 domain-containing protein [Candidatus Competibacterales bacterium]
MSQEAFANFEQFILVVQGLCTAQRSGMLFATNRAGRQAFIKLDRGRIGTIRVGRAIGAAALAELLQGSGGTYRFIEGAPLGSDQVSTACDAVIDQLRTHHRLIQGTSAAADPDQALRQRIAAYLDDLIGPVAQSLCQREFSQAQSWPDALSALAKALPSVEMREQFIAQFLEVIPEDRAPKPSSGTPADDEDATVDRAPAGPVIPSQAPGLSPGAKVDEEVQRLVEGVLMEYMGPIAPLLCQRVFAETADLDTALAQIALQMSKPTAAERFIERIRREMARR